MSVAIIVLASCATYVGCGVAAVTFRGRIEPRIAERQNRHPEWGWSPEMQRSRDWPECLFAWFFLWWAMFLAYGLHALARGAASKERDRIKSRAALEKELEAAKAEVDRLLGGT